MRDVLAPIYHHDMSLRDVLKVVLKAYEEALLEKRYEMPNGGDAGLNLLLAPMNRYVPPFTKAWPTLETEVTFEQMYDAFLAHMMGELMVARVDWIKEQLQDSPQGTAAVEHATPA